MSAWPAPGRSCSPPRRARAGYFNTVGSKEGWTPATFVSSRSNRAKYAQQRPEDFMDTEDRAEAEAGGKQVRVS